MEAILEGSLTAGDHLVDKHFDKGWDRVTTWKNGRKVSTVSVPYDASKDPKRASRAPPSDDSSSSSTDFSSEEEEEGAGKTRPTEKRALRSQPPARSITSRRSGGASLTGTAVPAAAAAAAATTAPATYSISSRRKQRNTLPPPDRQPEQDFSRVDSVRSLHLESETSDRVLRAYELEADDPKRRPESVLSSRDLSRLKADSRRDSGMSGYNDNYAQSQYAGETRPRSQPPRSRYYDDDEGSDYDERSGRRYKGGNGRGYDDDRDYDRIVEETERYRGPPVNRPWDPARQDSYRSGYDGPYGAGAVTQYGRRSEGALDRQDSSYVSRRSKSRGRGRDESYSRSPSPDDRSRERGDGIGEKIKDSFDLSTRGLGVGVAGAVIGGLAGREFGHKHRQRDIALGAIIGGLGANFAENKYREWKEDKERDLEYDERKLEQKFDGRDYGRSRSNVR